MTASDRYRPSSRSLTCRNGSGPQHPVQLVAGHRGGQPRAYLYAGHDGAHVPTCALHSGLCHEECWPPGLYPELRARIAPKEAGAGA